MRVMGDGGRAIEPMRLGRLPEDRELLYRLVQIGEMRRGQRARRRNLPKKNGDAPVLVERVIIDHGTHSRQQFAHHALVHVRVLAQVDRSQVEPEHVDRAAEQPEPTTCQRQRAISRQRR